MEIRPFQSGDVPAFLALAAAEGWISYPWEFAFLQGKFPQGCLAVEEEGRPVAFVTAIRYGTSGWIGNLLVKKERRGQGYGTLLMRRAVDELLAAGVGTVWLTASLAGRPIYERMGFREIDQIARWHGRGTGQGGACVDSMSLGDMVALDRAGWGDERQAILSAVVSQGSLLCDADGFLVVQRCGNAFQFGPWSCDDKRVASALAGRALGVAGEGKPVFLDAPVRNIAASTLLNSIGFSVTGKTSLMFMGWEPAYDPARIFALASMGGMG